MRRSSTRRDRRIGRVWTVVGVVALLVAAPLPAGAGNHYPPLSGNEWTDIVREGFSRLPNLSPPGEPAAITGDEALDDRIWEIAFSRGYEMRPTRTGEFAGQEGHSRQPLTAQAWEAMQTASAADCHSLVIHSAYRSIATQKAIFNADLDGTSDTAINDTLDFHAPPGASRHHTGYALDIKVAGGTIGGFIDTAAYEWITANNFTNAMRFGFVPSYPPDAPDQGPLPEPWEYVYVGSEVLLDSDELLFYEATGTYKYYETSPDATLGKPINSGDGYTPGWSAIVGVELDDLDNQDEVLFYRSDGLFRYYEIGAGGLLSSPILAGDGYSSNWSSITALDLQGDGQDELLFYSDDGTFKFYEAKPDASLGPPMLSGDGYSPDWSLIVAVDLDGSGDDELLFYKEDGTFKYYDVKSDGSLGSPILSGTGYSLGWSIIAALDLD